METNDLIRGYLSIGAALAALNVYTLISTVRGHKGFEHKREKLQKLVSHVNAMRAELPDWLCSLLLVLSVVMLSVYTLLFWPIDLAKAVSRKLKAKEGSK